MHLSISQLSDLTGRERRTDRGEIIPIESIEREVPSCV